MNDSVAVYRAMKRLYKEYIRRCRRRNIFWELSLEQFSHLTKQPCTYCKRPPFQKSRSYIYSGLDRMDNNLGYMITNVVPCCGFCNAIKSNLLTHSEATAAIEAVMRLRGRPQSG